jgi:hypothetical protein
VRAQHARLSRQHRSRFLGFAEGDVCAEGTIECSARDGVRERPSGRAP